MDEAAGDGSLGAAVATAGGSSVWSGVAEADAVVSLLDVFELERTWVPTELCAVPDVEPDEGSAAEADEFVDDVGPVDDVLAAESDDELAVDDDESDDELVELESVGSANATAGVFAKAAPMPSATADTPTRTTYCAFTGIPRFLAVRHDERRPVSFLVAC